VFLDLLAGRAAYPDAGRAVKPYERWINTYGDEVFGGRVRSVIAIADDIAVTAGSRAREDMLAAFHRAAWLEWMFWDGAYHRESWPV
jgi:thiaminase/transcriptional activator TenA